MTPRERGSCGLVNQQVGQATIALSPCAIHGLGHDKAISTAASILAPPINHSGISSSASITANTSGQPLARW